jgi:hypothetical protein
MVAGGLKLTGITSLGGALHVGAAMLAMPVLGPALLAGAAGLAGVMAVGALRGLRNRAAARAALPVASAGPSSPAASGGAGPTAPAGPAGGPAPAASSYDRTDVDALREANRLWDGARNGYHARPQTIGNKAQLKAYIDATGVAPELKDRVFAHLDARLNDEHARALAAEASVHEAQRAAHDLVRAEWQRKANAIGDQLAAHGILLPAGLPEDEALKKLEELNSHLKVKGTDAEHHLNELAALTDHTLRREILGATMRRLNARRASIIDEWEKRAKAIGVNLANARVAVPADLPKLVALLADRVEEPKLSRATKDALNALKPLLGTGSPALSGLLRNVIQAHNDRLTYLTFHPVGRLANWFRGP